MIQKPVDSAGIGPGDAHTWHLVLPDSTTAPTLCRAASYNQARHHSAASHAANTPVAFCIAATFELPGPVVLSALEAAFTHLVHRHEVLRTRYRSARDGVICDLYAPEDVRLEHVDAGPLTSHTAVRTHLHDTFRQVDPVAGPLVVMGVIARAASATVFVACDHLVTDVLSATIAAADIATAYRDFVRGRPSTPVPAGSYLAYARDEREQNQALDVGHARLNHWKEFTSRHDDFFPAFPLALGVEPGVWYPPVNTTSQLLNGRESELLEGRCEENGGRLVHGLLAAVAVAVRDEGGPDVYRALMPLNRRGRGQYEDALGWFVNAVPIEVPVPRRSCLGELVAGARKAHAAARAHADVHYVRAWQLLAPADTPGTGYRPVCFFSYLDFRGTPGDRHPAMHGMAVHVWASAANGIFLWLHRNHSGLHLNALYADTPQARHTTTALNGALVRTLHRFTGPGPLTR
ncbi:condensation domain-containing protein [Streptomyces sp. NPDC058122]|uniref:condensation domain-containing protein n=1 Tax=Streptomyces sp. NPDC058122 TaxID=3346349 RepID=UPI0036E3E94B